MRRGFSQKVLFAVTFLVLGVVFSAFVFSQGVNSFASTAQNPGHDASQIYCSGCVDTANLKDNAVTTTKISSQSVTDQKVDWTVCTQASGCNPGKYGCKFLLNTQTWPAPNNYIALPIPDKCLINQLGAPTGSTYSTGACTILFIVTQHATSSPDPVDLFFVEYAHQSQSLNRWIAMRSHTAMSNADGATGIPSTIRYWKSNPAAGVAGNVILNPVANIFWWDAHGDITTDPTKWAIRDTNSNYDLQMYVC